MELELFSERLRITPLVADDLDIALELWTDPEVVKYICDVPTEAEIRREMPDSLRSAGGTRHKGHWNWKLRGLRRNCAAFPGPVGHPHYARAIRTR